MLFQLDDAVVFYQIAIVSDSFSLAKSNPERFYIIHIPRLISNLQLLTSIPYICNPEKHTQK